MKATIISDSSIFVDQVRRAIDYLFGDIEAKNLFIVDLNLIIAPKDKRTQHLGLGVAKKAAENPKKIVILTSLESFTWLIHNEPEFASLMSLPNVGFVNAANLGKVWEVYRALSFGPQIDNPTGRQISEFKIRQSLLARLRHDLGHAKFHHHKIQLVISEAREQLGFAGSNLEVTSQILSSHDSSDGYFSDQLLFGIFVNIFGTLFDFNWRINKSIEAAIIRLAVEKGKTVFIISDSEDQFVKDQLVNHEVNWQFISKQALRGAKLEIVIDKLTKLEFEAINGINVRKFINVLDL